MTTIELGRYAVDTAYTMFLWWLAFRVIRGAVLIARDVIRDLECS